MIRAWKSCRTVVALYALVGLGASSLSAQIRAELVPFVGYRVGADLYDYTGTRVSTKNAMSFGGTVALWLSSDETVEISYSRQDTYAILSRPFDDITRIDANIDQWMVGASTEVAGPGDALRPFASGLLGLTRVTSGDGPGSISKFMLGVGVGTRLGERRAPLGGRLEARGYFTFVGGGSTYVGCSIGGGCGLGVRGRVFWQLDLLAGVVIGLGRG